MKEKNKKILKSLGVGALALVGVVGLTGCANNQSEEISKVQIVEQQTITKEKAYNLLQEAEAKLLLNYNDCWDGLKLENPDNVISSIEYIKASDGNYISYEYYENSGRYTVNSSDFQYVIGVNGPYFWDEENSNNYTKWSGINHIVYSLPLTYEYDLTIDDLLTYEILQDNTLSLHFMKDVVKNEGTDDQYVVRNYFQYEIKDSYLIATKISSGNISGDAENNPYTMVSKIKYNSANITLVEQKYQEALNFIASQE